MDKEASGLNTDGGKPTAPQSEVEVSAGAAEDSANIPTGPKGSEIIRSLKFSGFGVKDCRCVASYLVNVGEAFFVCPYCGKRWRQVPNGPDDFDWEEIQ